MTPDFREMTPQSGAEGGVNYATAAGAMPQGQEIRIGRGVIKELPEILRNTGISRPFILDDPDTYLAAGERVREILREAGIPFEAYSLPVRQPEPDDRSVGAAAMHFAPRCDGILSVGSGVINDIGKILSGISGKPQVFAATAPSMDGYASDSASMVTEGIKVSIPTPCPAAVAADTEILAAAPAAACRREWGYGGKVYFRLRMEDLPYRHRKYYCPGGSDAGDWRRSCP